MNKLKNFAYLGVIVLVALVAVGFGVNAYMGDSAPKVVVEGNYIEAGDGGGEIGAGNYPWHYGDLNIQGDLDVSGTIAGDNELSTLAPTVFATTTLVAGDSGKTYLLSATGTDIVLPAVTSTGFNVKFQVNGALDTNNVQVISAEGDNIEGTLIVAGAVVDCDAEDQINFVVDGENLGDYFEIMSDGTQWLLGDSGVLTSGKLTCTDPA